MGSPIPALTAELEQELLAVSLSSTSLPARIFLLCSDSQHSEGFWGVKSTTEGGVRAVPNLEEAAELGGIRNVRLKA